MFVNNTLRSLINIVISLALIAAVLPWFLLVLPVVGAAYVFLYVMFRVNIRRLQRFQLESMAPLLTHVDASVHGLSSVHAYQRVDDFQRRSASPVLKLYVMLYDIHSMRYWSTDAAGWLKSTSVKFKMANGAGKKFDICGILLGFLVAKVLHYDQQAAAYDVFNWTEVVT